MEIEEFVCDDENMMNSTLTSEELNANTSLNRSGLLHLTRSTNEIATQTASSAAANISPHQSRIDFEVTGEKFFGA